MQILQPTPQGIQQAIDVLKDGGVIAHATETCYGLACDMQNLDAVTKLFAIKKRSGDQPVSALFTDVDQAKEFVVWNEKAEELAGQHLPGPLTIILQLSGLLYPVVQEEPAATVGIRISSHPIAQELAEQFGSPISTTSANLHGLPSPYSAEEIVAQFEGQTDQPDIILDSGKLPDNPSSTVVDASGDTIKVIRQGAQQIAE